MSIVIEQNSFQVTCCKYVTMTLTRTVKDAKGKERVEAQVVTLDQLTHLVLDQNFHLVSKNGETYYFEKDETGDTI